MGRGKYLWGGLLILLLTTPSWADGLYLTTPKVTTADSNYVETGATGTFQVRYKKHDAYATAKYITGAMIKLSHDPAKVSNFDFVLDPNLTDNLEQSREEIKNGYLNVDIINKVGKFEPFDGDDILLGTVTFTVKKDFDLGGSNTVAWGVAWHTNDDLVNVSLFDVGKNLLSPLDTKREPVDWYIAKGTPPHDYAGISSVTDRTSGNSLSVNWSAGGDDLNHGAATYYGNGKLKYVLYRLDGNGSSFAFDANGDIINFSKKFSPTDELGTVDNGLTDNLEYRYLARVIDNTENLYEDRNQIVSIAVKPHDYTSPEANISAAVSGDDSLELTMSAGGGDVGGFILAKKVIGLNEAEPNLEAIQGISNAHDDEDGTLPDEAKTIIQGAGWTILGSGPTLPSTFPESGLDNRKKHVYALFVYDNALGDLQGNNYRRVRASGVPGTAPAVVSLFRVLSSLPNGMRFVWQPPGGSYTGAKIVYTTNYSEWTALTYNSPEVVVDKLLAAGSSGLESHDWLPADPASGAIHYFKAFAHNSSGLHSAGVYGAAVPGKVGTTEVVASALKVEVELKKRENGFGLNTIVLPFAGPYYISADGFGGRWIANVQELLDAVNAIGGNPNTVSTFGYWDKDSQQPVGFSFEKESPKVRFSRGTATDPAAATLEKNIGYQIYVRNNVPKFTLTERAAP